MAAWPTVDINLFVYNSVTTIGETIESVPGADLAGDHVDAD